MHKPIKYAEKGLSYAANGAWFFYNAWNQMAQKPSFTPAWADKPLLKSDEKVKPPLGWPRETDSLCPKCVREARQAILDGKKDYKDLLHEKVGEIKAQIVEDANREAGEISQRATREIELAKESALADLHQQSVDLSIDLAGKLIHKNLSAEDNQALIDETVKGFSDN